MERIRRARVLEIVDDGGKYGAEHLDVRHPVLRTQEQWLVFEYLHTFKLQELRTEASRKAFRTLNIRLSYLAQIRLVQNKVHIFMQECSVTFNIRLYF